MLPPQSSPQSLFDHFQEKCLMNSSPTSRSAVSEREEIVEGPNPLGLEGVEFIEYATSKPQALGQVLETMGFRPIARHRSREVLRYRQGDINIIVNAHSNGKALTEKPVMAAVALRVRDASTAYRRALERGAWAVPVRVEVMELNIPAVHGVGTSRIYFVDRHKEFSIYDVDFTPIPTVDQLPPSIAGLHFFGLVQYIGNDRIEDWTEFYSALFGFTTVPPEERFGILPKGRILRSPHNDASGSFYLQLIEPEPGVLDVEDDECLQRMGLGTPDVPTTVAQLRQRGVEFQTSKGAQLETRGALTRTVMGSVMFELVHHDVTPL
jgi:4-hydroxyphenylpyruvate dioxygenase